MRVYIQGKVEPKVSKIMLYKPHGAISIWIIIPEAHAHRYKPYATSVTQRKPMNSDSDSDVVLSHCSVAVQTSTVDGKCWIFVCIIWEWLTGAKEIKQVLQLQATIDKLESELEISTWEISKYWILWKNECRAADADRYGRGVSQTSWSSTSPHHVYCES